MLSDGLKTALEEKTCSERLHVCTQSVKHKPSMAAKTKWVYMGRQVSRVLAVLSTGNNLIEYFRKFFHRKLDPQEILSLHPEAEDFILLTFSLSLEFLSPGARTSPVRRMDSSKERRACWYPQKHRDPT